MTDMNTESDIAIVGAGPAGSCAAWEALQGEPETSVSIFEEHHQIGKPVHCSGLISLEGLQKLKINMGEIDRKICQNKIRRARFVGPNFKSFEIDRGSYSMGVIDRISLDCLLAERTKEFGCSYYLGHRVTKIYFNKKHGWTLHIRKKNKSKIHRSKILISAEGIHARLSASIGLPSPNKNWIFPALQYEIQNVEDLDNDCVELYFSQKYAPGFFGWVIPINENLARIGIAIRRQNTGMTRFLMNRFMKKHPLLSKRFKIANILKTYGGFVSGAGPIKKTYFDNFMVAGDAAGQSKATTGGGVNIGGYCGRLAGITARNIVSKGIHSPQSCQDYQRKWRSLFEPDLSLMKLFRRILTPLPDEAWNKIIEIAKDTDIGRSIKNSSIDLHGFSLLKYSLNPRVLIRGLNLVPQAAISLLQGFFT